MKHTKCFIFGSNESGFHGAGTAGFAFRGESANTWRNCPIMREAMIHGPGYVGKLAVFGIGRGFQVGSRGCSYAIATVTRPGALRSIPLEEMRRQTKELVEFMRGHPNVEFALTPFGAGYAGWNKTDMQPIWEMILSEPNGRWSKTVTSTSIINKADT